MKVKKICKFCGKDYYVSPYRKDASSYCSNSCRSKDKTGELSGAWKGGKVERTCERCHKVYYLFPSFAVDNKYCSASCRSQSIDNHGSHSHLWTGGKEEVTCHQCGKKFPGVRGHNRQYCSKECHDKSRQVREVGTCVNCGTSFDRQKSRAKRYDLEFCSIKCMGQYKIGEKSNGWRGGISFAPDPPTFNTQFKRMICERDNYTCAICKGRGNIVHHINYVKNDTNPGNCITLCRSCHGKTNAKRDYWISFFSQM